MHKELSSGKYLLNLDARDILDIPDALDALDVLDILDTLDALDNLELIERSNYACSSGRISSI